MALIGRPHGGEGAGAVLLDGEAANAFEGKRHFLVPVFVANAAQLPPAKPAVSRRRGGETLRYCPDKGNGLEPGCQGQEIRGPFN